MHEYRDDQLVLFERGRDLDADEVVGLVEPPGTLVIARVEPALTDDRQQHIAFRDLLLQHAYEVAPWRNAVDVHEEFVAWKHLLQTVEQAAGVAGIVAPS